MRTSTLTKLAGLPIPSALQKSLGRVSQAAAQQTAAVQATETQQVFNFSAGPCCLPKEVLATAAAEMTDWQGTGVGVMEMSHRGKAFTSISEQAKADLRTLLEIPDNFTIFFSSGGASLQFSAVPLNLFGDDPSASANYLVTGSWSKAAFTEAKKFGDITKVSSNEELGYATIPHPDDWNIKEGAKYFHYCDNETIQGFEFDEEFPFDRVPEGQTLVCDMSSNFCTKKIDWSKYGVVYAGAQKNVGPAGVCITVVRNDLIGKQRKDTPLLCDWAPFAKAPNTFHNTPSCWPIYVCGLNLAHMLQNGGLEGNRAAAKSRAEMLYKFIDESDGYFSNGVESRYRSRLNIPFRVGAHEGLEAKFVKEATAEGLIELKGHRSVGGCRASLYTAMPHEGVLALTDFMGKFRAENPIPE